MNRPHQAHEGCRFTTKGHADNMHDGAQGHGITLAVEYVADALAPEAQYAERITKRDIQRRPVSAVQFQTTLRSRGGNALTASSALANWPNTGEALRSSANCCWL
jgi:hypothetical protein